MLDACAAIADLAQNRERLDHIALVKLADIIHPQFADGKAVPRCDEAGLVKAQQLPEMRPRLGLPAHIKHCVHMPELVAFPAIDAGTAASEKPFGNRHFTADLTDRAAGRDA